MQFEPEDDDRVQARAARACTMAFAASGYASFVTGGFALSEYAHAEHGRPHTLSRDIDVLVPARLDIHGRARFKWEKDAVEGLFIGAVEREVGYVFAGSAPSTGYESDGDMQQHPSALPNTLSIREQYRTLKRNVKTYRRRSVAAWNAVEERHLLPDDPNESKIDHWFSTSEFKWPSLRPCHTPDRLRMNDSYRRAAILLLDRCSSRNEPVHTQRKFVSHEYVFKDPNDMDADDTDFLVINVIGVPGMSSSDHALAFMSNVYDLTVCEVIMRPHDSGVSFWTTADARADISRKTFRVKCNALSSPVVRVTGRKSSVANENRSCDADVDHEATSIYNSHYSVQLGNRVAENNIIHVDEILRFMPATVNTSTDLYWQARRSQRGDIGSRA